MKKTRPFDISKQVVYQAYLRVKANGGSSGIDEQSIEEFEKDLKKNLYKIWNRMSSGTYFPPPVKTVLIPKKDKGAKPRKLGVPTVSDRIAQTVAKLYLEPIVEPKLHEDCYGYRPGKSAIQAVGVARKRCWKYNWCIDLDIVGFFDNLDRELILKAVRYHTDIKWISLYIERWLKAPIQSEDGTLVYRDKGTAQGSAISPLISNIFMHHAFCDRMRRNFPTVPFEVYADDALVHCRSKKEAERMLKAIEGRLKQCKLELHPEKTKIVYCKDADRRGSHEHERFDFLGYTFRPRLSQNRMGKHFVNFSPAISDNAIKAIKKTIRSWRIHLRPDKSLEDIARMFNVKVQGWINYYGNYYKSAMYPCLRNIERSLIRWAMKKYKRLRGHKTRAKLWLGRIARREPKLFAHWRLGLKSPVE
jgi:RNA-directed DNA polymerase